MIRIVTISGNARPGNYTGKTLALVQDEIRLLGGIDLIEIDPSPLRLTIPGSTMDASDGNWLRETVLSADGVVLATPEYHGTFSSLVKLVIENLGFPSALSGKPVALLGVAGGRIGAIKSLEHLRSVCSHAGALVLPGPVSVAKARSAFDENGNCVNPQIEQAVRGLAHKLVHYMQDTTCPDVSLEEMARTGRY